MSTIKVNAIESRSGNSLTFGATGDTITLGGSSFNGTSSVIWDTTAKTSGFTAVSGSGYFVDTSSAAITATLPASPSAGDIVAFKDYAATFNTNNLTIARNGSNIQGEANDSLITTNRASVVLVYVDATKGWLYTNSSDISSFGPLFIATGGTITTSGDFKIHTFTSSGTFTVTSTSPTSNTVDYLVIAGGAGGGNGIAGGGGAGGYRESFPNPATGGLSVSAQAYPITVGAGGDAGNPSGGAGSNSVFSSITSAGGGGGGGVSLDGNDGGSGGGGSGNSARSGGSGNTPSVSPPQGNDGGDGVTNGAPTGDNSGGGGGASAAGANGVLSPTPVGGNGGDGSASSITGSSVTRGGGGGGSVRGGPGTPGSGGAGGGGQAGGGGPGATTVAGTANTGGGGGGGGWPAPTYPGAAGGSGVVIIRYKFK